MTQMPRPPQQRFKKGLATVGDTLGMLLRKTLVLEDGCNVVNYVATISAGYSSGQPTVVMPDGSTAGPYPVLHGYTPVAGDVVVMIPNGQSYIIAGAFA